MVEENGTASDDLLHTFIELEVLQNVRMCTVDRALSSEPTVAELVLMKPKPSLPQLLKQGEPVFVAGGHPLPVT